MDVVLDLINNIHQQQFLTIAYVPKENAAQEVARERALKLASRAAHLQATAQRLQKGAAALQRQLHIDNVFAEQVAEVRKRWKVQRTSTGMLYVDLSLSLHLPEGPPTSVARFNLVPDGAGAVCIVLRPPAVSSNDNINLGGATERQVKGVAVRGWCAVHDALTNQHQLVIWETTAHLLETQSRIIEGSGQVAGASNVGAAGSFNKEQSRASREGHDVAHRVLLRMADLAVSKSREAVGHTITAARKTAVGGVPLAEPNAMEIDDNAQHPSSPRQTSVSNSSQLAIEDQSNGGASGTLPWLQSQVTADIWRFATLPAAQLHFEAQALSCLADILDLHAQPAMLLEIQGRKKSDVNMAWQLRRWLMHAARTHGIQMSLEEQQQQQGAKVQVRRLPTNNTNNKLTSVWRVTWAAAGSKDRGVGGEGYGVKSGLLIVQGEDGIRWQRWSSEQGGGGGDAITDREGGSEMLRRKDVDQLLSSG